MKLSRRSFLKNSTAASAGVLLSAGIVKNVIGASAAGTGLVWPDTGALQINPDIDNLRVVVCNDPSMITGTSTGTWQSYNNAIDTVKLQANMDKMAMALAQKTDAKSAWATIFRKPQTKTWSQVKVALKVNCVDGNDMPKLAIIDKICRALNSAGTTSADPGVPFANITVYDTPSRVATTYAGTYAASRVPAGIKASQNLGSTVPYLLPRGNANLLAGNLNNGTIDILINIALNKGHDQFDKGKVTLCQKNHYGTFQAQPASYPKPDGCGGIEYLLDINKSRPILGGTPIRQQLCIVDSLWAMEGGPTGGTMVKNNRIVMGVFAGAVDYLVAKKIRQSVMNIPVGTVDNDATHRMNATAINRYITGYNYDLTAPGVADLDFVDALTWVPVTGINVKTDAANAGRKPSLQLRVSNRRLKSSNLNFVLPHNTSSVRMAIFDMNGRTVRVMEFNPIKAEHSTITWDGKTSTNEIISAGNYIVRLVGENFEQTGKIVISY